MTCACESVHEFPCQFPAETEFFDFNGKQWCRFHLPLQDGKGNESIKVLWRAGRVKCRPFWEEVENRLQEASEYSSNSNSRADLRGVNFPPYFKFTGIADVINADFEKATFGDNVCFEHTTFADFIRFSGATFGDGANFHRATFGKMSSFWKVIFGENVNFHRAIFGEETLFNGAKFGRGSIFDCAQFADGANFSSNPSSRTTFGFMARFRGATFGDRASFHGATFSELAQFDGAVFGNLVHFDGTSFGDDASFAKVTFQGEAYFSANKAWNSKIDFPHMDFSGAEFNSSCSFVNRDFASGANFNGAVFHDLVEFHGCTFHPGMSFHQTKFLKTKGEDDNTTYKLEKSYSTLKFGMEGLRARNEEADFFALEMECRRQRGSVPWFERFAATAYKHLSDYGRSIARPLVWMVFTLGYGFAYFYHLAQAKSFRAPGDVLRFVMEQVVTPFSIWTSQYKFDPWMMKYQDEHPMLMLLRVPATLITLMAITLIALFLLALRRRFKMD